MISHRDPSLADHTGTFDSICPLTQHVTINAVVGRDNAPPRRSFPGTPEKSRRANCLSPPDTGCPFPRGAVDSMFPFCSHDARRLAASNLVADGRGWKQQPPFFMRIL